MVESSRKQGGGGDKEGLDYYKSLDELVSEDHQMRQNKFAGGNNGGAGRGGKGRSGGYSQDSRGNGANRFGGHHRQQFADGGGNGDDSEDERPPRYHNNHRGRGRGRGGRGGHHHHHNQSRSPAQGNSSDGGMGDQRVEQVDAYGNNVEGRRVFVSNLAFETQWKYLKDHMRQVGDVVRADIFEKPDGQSRGIGLVEFKTKGGAAAAIRELNESMLDGRKLYLKKDTQGHVFPPLKSKKDMMGDDYNGRGDFRGRGGRGRGSFQQQPRYKDRRMSRSRSGSGSPNFRNQRGAYRQSRGGASFTANDNGNNNPEKLVDSGGSPEPRQRLTIQRRSMQPEESSTAPTFSIHISNLPFSVDKDQLRGAFNEFGNVLHASVSLDERGQSRGLGTVEYDKREAAEQAALSMDKAIFNGREVAVIFSD